MDNNKLIIKKLSVKNLNYQQIENLIKEAFSTVVAEGINAVAANITIDKIAAKKESESFSIFDENKIVGILIYKITGNICYVDKLAVSPKYQSFGIGKKLINELFNECKTLKIKKIWLHTFEYKRNINFYESLGFVKYGLKHNTSYYFSIIYCKYLNENKIRNYMLYTKYVMEKFLYKNILFYSPSKLTFVGKFVKKIKNVFKK